MRLRAAGAPHLTYCTNIHAGETLREVRSNLATHVLAVKKLLEPDRPFGVGLRLSAKAAAELEGPGETEALLAFLEENGLYVFTLNGFPAGVFQGARVKEQVYRPDWLEPDRLLYTNNLARLLARLLPEGLEGSVSTVPCAYKARLGGDGDIARMAGNLLAHASVLHRLREQTGKTLALALEPEPCCHLETTAEAIAFFEGHLFSRAALASVRAMAGVAPREAEPLLRRHLGICFDACHMAVEFEDAAVSLRSLMAAGIRVPKIQISAGLRVEVEDASALKPLQRFADDVYLHQVVENRGGELRRHADLPEALSGAHAGDQGPREWRIHFHVPVFREELGSFRTTQRELRGLLALLAREALAPHLEVETYTWDVLPAEFRRGGVAASVARELAWARDELERPQDGAR